MTPDWQILDAELAHWAQAGLRLPLWWRDDDATEPTQALDQLAALSGKVGLPIHLAVIPAYAANTLAHVVDGQCLIPVVHGWSHHNHAPDGQKKSEYPVQRPLADMIQETSNSLRHLNDLFQGNLLAMFVPPWNRISPSLIAELPALGFHSLSTFTPRSHDLAAPGLSRINTHLDPIAWHAGKSLVEPNSLIAQLTRQLHDRRTGAADNTEPYGILTHHLVHDAAIWGFTEQLIQRLMQGPAFAWSAPEKDPEYEQT